MLLRVEECIEIVALGEITLRRSGVQPALGVVANRAGLLRFSGELHDMTVDTGFVTGKLQAQSQIAIGARNDAFGHIHTLVALIAFQLTALLGARDFNHPEM